MTIYTDTPELCQTHCQQNEACVEFMWSAVSLGNWDGNANRCFLKSQTTQDKKPTVGLVSGPKHCGKSYQDGVIYFNRI